MKPTIKMLGIAFAASTALATAAQAQREGYGSTAPQTQPQPRGAEQQKEKPLEGRCDGHDRRPKIKISPAFTKAYQELVAAIEATTRNIPAKVAAAHAAAQTGEEHFLASQAQLKVAVAAEERCRDRAPRSKALIASGSLPQDSLGQFLSEPRQDPVQPETVSRRRLRLSRRLCSFEPEQSGGRRRCSRRRDRSAAIPTEAVAMLRRSHRPAERKRREGSRGYVQASDLARLQGQAGGARRSISRQWVVRLSDARQLERCDPHLSQSQQRRRSRRRSTCFAWLAPPRR